VTQTTFLGALFLLSSPFAFAAATATLPATSATKLAPPVAASGKDAALVENLCTELKASISALHWKDLDPCTGMKWIVHGKSINGRPLIYAEFGDPASTNVTLIFSAVHGDEITPVYLGFKVARWTMEHEADLKNAHVIIVPFVNPDGFYQKPRTRMNAHGVDVNRNFATHDWKAGALVAWKKHLKSDPRRFPGYEPASEPETRLQQQLIKKFHPKKILSVHAPLNHLDYDGPNTLSLARFPGEYVRECLKLRTALKAVSTGYFPGSLGNYAGQELGIPTITLELPTANPAKAEQYWQSFSSGIRTMMEYVIPDQQEHAKAL
jgi:protein MpaA